jgi:tetratricopeptide (TPR) repeat protein
MKMAKEVYHFYDLEENLKKYRRSIELSRILDLMGAIYFAIRKTEKSIKISEKSLEIYKAINGEDHINYGISLMNLAVSLQKLGILEEALEKFLKAQKIFENHYGTFHV